MPGPNCNLLLVQPCCLPSRCWTKKTAWRGKEIGRIGWNTRRSVRMKTPLGQAPPRTYDWFKGHAFPRFYSRARRSSVVPNPEYLTPADLSIVSPVASFSCWPKRPSREIPPLSCSLSFRVRLSPPTGAMLITNLLARITVHATTFAIPRLDPLAFSLRIVPVTLLGSRASRHV